LPDLVLCDDVNTGDGVEAFDLTQNEALLLNGEAGVTPTYHTSAVDADSGANAIPDPTAHVNTASPLEDIYVRVENDVTGCYTVVEFSIVVNPLPEVVAVTDFIQCELGTDGFAQFDLTQKDAEVLGGQDPGSYTVSYHETLADAEALANGITGLYTNTSNPQEIYVAITDNVTGCSVATQRFDLEVQEAAQANPGMEPLVYPLCDDGVETDGDPSNDSVQFQLSSLDGEVLDGQDPAAYTVSYYATQQDAELFVNPLPDLYENVSNPQVIYVRVDNDTPDGTGQDSSICFDVAAVELRVDPLPVIGLEDSYLLCVGTDGSEVVDVPVLDTGLSAADHTFEWSLDGQVLAGETGPSLVPMQGGTYTVRAENVLTGCFDERSTEVGESGPPSLVADLVTEAFSEGNVIEALATGDGVYEYSLDGGPWQEEGVFTDVRPGIRVVYARDVNGCGVASVEVAVIDYPRFFTPNGDGNNDTWNIIGLGGQPNAKIYIFDRYGKLLKQLAPNGAGWDGTFNGNRMPTSDYWFTLAYQEPLTGEPREFRAHFTLKR
jgi:gliding motility-associated-like protein